MVVTLGALLADSPHTRPVPVTGTSSDEGRRAGRCTSSRPATRARPASSGSCRTPAPGPAYPALSIWAAVPHYVAQPPCPKATLALLRHIEDLLDVPIPLGDLPEDARAWERGVDELAAEDAEVADYVRSLEEAKDLTEAPEASGDAIAREFERYLRRRGDDHRPRRADAPVLYLYGLRHDRYPGGAPGAGAARADRARRTSARPAPWRARPCSAAGTA